MAKKLTHEELQELEIMLSELWTEGGIRNLPSGARSDDDRAIEGFGAREATRMPNGNVTKGPGASTEVRIRFK